jgi:hypothetical protein
MRLEFNRCDRCGQSSAHMKGSRYDRPEKLYLFQANQISTRVSIAVNVRYEAFPGGAADYQRR